MTSSDVLEKLVCIEAMLIAILVYLPPKSIFRFKCVSKTWNRILAEPFFLRSYYKTTENGGQRFLAFINSRMAHFASADVLRHRNPYTNPSDTLPLTQNKYNFNQMVPKRFGQIHHSYNGLILCIPTRTTNTCYIINPVTRMWLLLPPLDVTSLAPLGLTWEDNMHNLIPIYKVVKAYTQQFREEENAIVIDTYCSKSAKWAKSKLIGREDFEIDDSIAPIVSNGVFYWHVKLGEVLAVYDTKRDEKHVQLIKLPNSTHPYRRDLTIPATVSSHDDTLWFGTKAWREDKLKFYILPKDKQQDGYKEAISVERKEWTLIHTICINTYCPYLDATVARDDARAWLNLLGLIPCYPVLAVFSNHTNIFLYNVESKCIELVSDRGSSDIDSHNSFWLRPYVESFSLSSYALSTTYY